MAFVRKSSASFARRAAISIAAATMVACSGGGDDAAGGSGTAMVTVSGRITFDRVPFKAQLNTGLNFGAPVESPARQVVVEAVDTGSSAILATTTTDTSGNYSFDVPANRNVFIRAKAQMLKTGASPTWNFQVLNNTNSDALYALDGTSFNTGTGASTRNLRAQTGWGVTNYNGTRAAAPFAILDTMYQVKALILSAKADTAFPALDLFWSDRNRPSDFFCPDSGDIVSSLYTVFSTSSPNDECATSTPGRSGIYVLGSFTVGDTDEFDQHVIAHETGHYFEDRFSRSDSIGGSHSLTDRLDLRVAFGEGWGNAFGAMVLNDPVYRDSFSGANQDSGFNLESQSSLNIGWFSELSISKILWDVFDPANDDSVALGFVPVYAVMTGAQPSTDALTSIFPFATALKANYPGSAAGINALLAAQGISPVTDDFGSMEVAFAGGENVFPIYSDIVPGMPQQSCSSAAFGGEYNRISNRRFLRFLSGSARTVTISVTVSTGSVNADPDFVLWRRGAVVAIGEEIGSVETRQVAVEPGTYVLEIYDYNHVDGNAATGTGTTCMSVSIAG